MTAIFLQIWNYLSWRTKFGLAMLLFCSIAFGYFYFQKSSEKREVEKQLNEFLEGQAVKDSQRLNESRNAVKQAETATNTARNANYSNLSDKELRERIIRETEKIK
jgi:hypothetical protein